MPDQPDLAALRSRDVRSIADGYLGRQHEYESIAKELLLLRKERARLLALVDRLQEYVDANEASFAASERVHAGDAEPASMARYLARLEAARAALGLAGSPAANEEQQ